MNETTSQKPSEQPGASPSCAEATGSDLLDALALAEGDPRKCSAWMDRAAPMRKHCRPNEDVYAAAARILAAEVRRLTVDKAENDAALERIASHHGLISVTASQIADAVEKRM